MRLIDAEGLEARALELQAERRMTARELAYIMQVIQAEPPVRMMGYRVDDLTIIAELLRAEGITKETVRKLVDEDISWIYRCVKTRFDEEFERHMKEIAEGMGAK